MSLLLPYPVRPFIVLLAVWTLSCGHASVQARLLAPETSRAVDALFGAYDREDTPGYVVGVVRNGELVFSRAYGMANLDHGVPLSSKTPFHLASVSKQFTGAAIALLIRDGRLSLEDPVARWLPSFARFGSELQLKHLVYMTSGLPEYWDVPRPGGAPWQSFHYFDTDDMLAAVLSAERLTFAPGTDWRYVNSNYLVLAKIVEAASGSSLADFLRVRVFEPLGMERAHLDDDSTLIVPGRATGYIKRNASLAAEGRKMDLRLREGDGWARLNRVSPHYGGSGVFASLEDLAKWDANWYSEKVGGPGFTALMHSRYKFAHSKDNDAFGLVRNDQYGLETWSYAGGDLDASTYMARFPAARLTVICLSNMPMGAAEDRCRAMLDVLRDAGVLRP
jgi:CubicO group peptidase (beta-lactamase class C family)